MKTSTLVIIAVAVVAGVVIYRRTVGAVKRAADEGFGDGTTPFPDQPAGNTGIVPTFPPPPKSDGVFSQIAKPPVLRSSSLDNAFNLR
jgi:hypothetical protein